MKPMMQSIFSHAWFRALLFFCIASAGIHYAYPQINHPEPPSAVWEQTGYALGPLALSWAFYSRQSMTIKNRIQIIAGWLGFITLLGILFHFYVTTG